MKKEEVIRNYGSEKEKQFLNLFIKYKKNKENVDESMLKGKYANAYNTLRKDLAKAAGDVCIENSCRCIHLMKDDTVLLNTLHGIMEAAGPAISQAVFKNMDLEEYFRIIDQTAQKVYATWWDACGEERFIEASLRMRNSA